MREPNSAKQPESHAGVRGNLLPEKEDNGREAEPCDVVTECALTVAASRYQGGMTWVQPMSLWVPSSGSRPGPGMSRNITLPSKNRVLVIWFASSWALVCWGSWHGSHQPVPECESGALLAPTCLQRRHSPSSAPGTGAVPWNTSSP